MKFHFDARYFILTLILLLIEILIAVNMHDHFIRPYAGDFLVVILLYCFVRSFLLVPVLPTAFCVLLFSCVVEAGQYFHLITILGWEHSAIAKVILGNSFSGLDILMYASGIVCVVVIEKMIAYKQGKMV